MNRRRRKKRSGTIIKPAPREPEGVPPTPVVHPRVETDGARRIHKTLQHPIWPIIAGVGLAMDGPGNISVRVLFFSGVALWIALDVFLWLKGRYSGTSFWVRMILSAIALALVVITFRLWLLHLKTDSEEIAAYQGLQATVRLPPSGIPEDSRFTFTNGGPFEIGRHDIRCGINLLVGNHRKHTWSSLSGEAVSSTANLRPGGDSETETCISMIHFESGVNCLDITLHMNYVLTRYPEILKSKEFRFFAHEQDGGFDWVSEPVSTRGSYCYPYVCDDCKKRLLNDNPEVGPTE